MAQNPPNSPVSSKNDQTDTPTNQELNELRSLLLGVEPQQLNRLYERLNNPQIQAEDVSKLLPEAVKLGNQKDTELVEAIVPTVESAIKFSIAKDENVLSEVIFPILAPATRKAITTALEQMIQTLNQSLEHSLSPQSLRWRLEAKRTGKTFAEVVILRTLIYRVEQLFLIHKHTGLLLQHIVAPQVSTQDADMVSAMLTAIQDFVKDSFAIRQGDGLQSLQFGGLTIWVEESSHSLLAGVIRGIPPQELRLRFQDAIAKIERHFGQELDNFQGEAAPFTASKPYLLPCLGIEYKSTPPKNYTYAWGLLSVVAIALGIWGIFAIQEQRKWHKYLAELNSQPGIVVMQAERRYDGKFVIVGMRDPLAKEPQELLKQVSIPPQKVISKWQNYISLDTQLIAKRATTLLLPPTTTSFVVDSSGTLKASGVAPQKWIARSQQLWRFVPGVNQYDIQGLTTSELTQLNTYKQEIENNMLFFFEGKTELLPDESSKIANLVVIIKKILPIAAYLNQDISIQIIGHTNTTGTEQQNQILSQARARKIFDDFQNQGLNQNIFTVAGVGYSQPISTNQENQISNRRVSFRVLLNHKSK
jgi:OOP family OmpA-OmpF porin